MTELAPLSPFKEKFLNLFYRAAVSGALPVSFRTMSILQKRLREENITEGQKMAEFGAVREFHFIHMKKGLRQKEVTWKGGDDKSEQVLKESGVTDYGVEVQTQRLIAQIRTDLDTFSELEAYSLMCSAYLMSEKELPSEKDVGHRWNFLRVREFLKSPGLFGGMKRQLAIARHKVFRVFLLYPLLNWLVTVPIGLAVLAGGAFLIYENWDQPLRLETTLGSLVATIFVFALAFIPGVKWIVKLRKIVKDLVMKLSAAVVAFLVVHFNLLVFEPLVIRKGRLPEDMGE